MIRFAAILLVLLLRLYPEADGLHTADGGDPGRVQSIDTVVNGAGIHLIIKTPKVNGQAGVKDSLIVMAEFSKPNTHFIRRESFVEEHTYNSVSFDTFWVKKSGQVGRAGYFQINNNTFAFGTHDASENQNRIYVFSVKGSHLELLDAAYSYGNAYLDADRRILSSYRHPYTEETSKPGKSRTTIKTSVSAFGKRYHTQFTIKDKELKHGVPSPGDSSEIPFFKYAVSKAMAKKRHH